MFFCLNGRFVPASKAMIPVSDAGCLQTDGFYDTMRVYQGKIFELPLHLRRIAATAQALELPLPISLEKIGVLLLQIVQKNALQEARVRITVMRGGKKPMFVITCEAVKNTSKKIKELSACTMHFQRTLPTYKTLGGLAILPIARKEAKRRGCDEIIGITSDGFIGEAATSNVFLVRRGILFTPKRNILLGLTRARVIVLARKAGIAVKIRNITPAALHSADEIFLTNRVRELMPITTLSGKKVGKGTLGPVTKRLMQEYQKYIQGSLA